MNQNWLSVAGLVADLIGFSILVWDLLPRYFKEREIQEYEDSLQNAECIHVESRNSDGSVFYVNDQLDLSKRVMRAWKRRGGWAIPEHLEANPERVKILSEADVDFMVPFITRIINQRRMALDEFERQPRPPLVAGVALILLGFLLQILGALPI